MACLRRIFDAQCKINTFAVVHSIRHTCRPIIHPLAANSSTLVQLTIFFLTYFLHCIHIYIIIEDNQKDPV